MDSYLQNFQQKWQKSLEHLQLELSKLQTGRANSSLVEHIDVELYGSVQPLKNIASISIPDSRTISIQPWDKSAISAISKGILQSGISLNPQDNGTSIILSIPPLTEERRKDMVKLVKKIGEEGKIAVRQIRQTAMDEIKQAEMAEDQKKGAEKKLQEKVDTANKDIDELVKKKEQEVMTI